MAEVTGRFYAHMRILSLTTDKNMPVSNVFDLQSFRSSKTTKMFVFDTIQCSLLIHLFSDPFL